MSRRLGKGLGALIPELNVTDDEKIIQVKLDQLRPNPYQPRKEFDPNAIEELKNSILEHGVVQPIIIRKSLRGYEIIAGERRYRASIEAGLETIPAVVKDFSDAQIMEIALIENLQREDLNPMEIAVAYQKLMDHFDLTQESLAKKVGKSRPHVANFLRLLQLPENIQEHVSRGTLSMGHAKALLGVKDRKQLLQLAKKTMEENLSVRQLESLVQDLDNKTVMKKKKTRQKTDVFLKQYEEKLRGKLGTAVKIISGVNKGKIEIQYYSQEDLKRILEILDKD